ncbi:CRP-like cAMP-binding protein [Chitinophaga skermanii]|uniref:CRP-like cAMP-binding protein n=1 Tax=Chitinophaga skermanii TaxID=331697 RepID=A0A327QB54_9BACT|nr:Crp/Fnr family transcriptional regulator [Chitinophaga skermanii]RAJ00433.1 CRP-like cAMP-binding protein [Chitinophaga skermanii]
MEALFKYIQQFGRLTKEDEQVLQSVTTETTIAKGDYFVEAGRICARLGFVEDGIFRSCYYNKMGEDFTRYFVYEGRFIGDMNGFIDRIPATEYIEAVTDARILTISRDDFALLEEKIENWSTLFARLNASVLENKMKAASNMLVQDGQTRYLHFLDHYPGLANRIPQSMLASYLGVTPSSLSRIRRNIG